MKEEPIQCRHYEIIFLLMSEIIPNINSPNHNENNSIATQNTCSNNTELMSTFVIFVAINDGGNRHAIIHHPFSINAEDTKLTVTDPNLNNADTVQ